MSEIFSLPELVAWIIYRNPENVTYARNNDISCWELFENELIQQSSSDALSGEEKSPVILLRDELLDTLKTGKLIVSGKRPGTSNFEQINPMEWRSNIESIDQYIEQIKPTDAGRLSILNGRWKAEVLFQDIFVDKEPALKFWPEEASAVVEKSIYHTGVPGKPSPIQFVEAEGKRRRDSGIAHETLASEARYLHEWCTKTHPGIASPKPKTIENRIRRDFNSHRHA